MRHSYTNEEMSKTGIYKITCTANNRFYIGSASCFLNSLSKIGFRGRLAQHLSNLNRNRHRNVILQNSWNLYGEDTFVFEILELTTPKDAIHREQYYLDTLSPFGEQGFNICRNSLQNHKPKPKRRIYTRDNTMINNDQKIVIVQRDKLGNFIQEIKGIKEAGRLTGAHSSLISKCCRGILKSTANFLWEYKYPNPYLGKRSQRKRSIKVINLETGEVNVYQSIAETCRQIDYCKQTIESHLRSQTSIENKYKVERLEL